MFFKKKEPMITLAEHERIVAGLNKQLTEQFDLSSKFAAANHRQAYCIQQCAAILGPDFAATVDGLPNGVRHVVSELSRLKAARQRGNANLKQNRKREAAERKGVDHG